MYKMPSYILWMELDTFLHTSQLTAKLLATECIINLTTYPSIFMSLNCSSKKCSFWGFSWNRQGKCYQWEQICYRCQQLTTLLQIKICAYKFDSKITLSYCRLFQSSQNCLMSLNEGKSCKKSGKKKSRISCLTP